MPLPSAFEYVAFSIVSQALARFCPRAPCSLQWSLAAHMTCQHPVYGCAVVMAETSANYAAAHTCVFEVFKGAADMPDAQLIKFLFYFTPIRLLCAIQRHYTPYESYAQ